MFSCGPKLVFFSRVFRPCRDTNYENEFHSKIQKFHVCVCWTAGLLLLSRLQIFHLQCMLSRDHITVKGNEAREIHFGCVLRHAKQGERRFLVYKRIRESMTLPEVKQSRKFSPRMLEGMPLYATSAWGPILVNPRFQDPTDRKGGQLFRRRCKVPYPVFQEIVRLTREFGRSSQKGKQGYQERGH